MDTYESFPLGEFDSVEKERQSFLRMMEDPQWKSPVIGAFNLRVADIAEGQKIQRPVNFCDYLHFGVVKHGLDHDWAEIAAAIQFSLGKTAEEQINATYAPLLEIPKTPVFLCHASEDKIKVRRYAAMLFHVGYSPWFDEDNLVPGQNWKDEIGRVIKTCFAFIVFISQHSHKQGYIQNEIEYALDEAERQHKGRIFLIPAKLEACDPPDRLAHLHWVNLYADGGFSKLCQALRVRHDQVKSDDKD